MAVKDQVDALLKEKMDRKDFLKYAGTVILGVIGVTGIIRLILASKTVGGQLDSKKSSGYGSSTYGN